MTDAPAQDSREVLRRFVELGESAKEHAGSKRLVNALDAYRQAVALVRGPERRKLSAQHLSQLEPIAAKFDAEIEALSLEIRSALKTPPPKNDWKIEEAKRSPRQRPVRPASGAKRGSENAAAVRRASPRGAARPAQRTPPPRRVSKEPGTASVPGRRAEAEKPTTRRTAPRKPPVPAQGAQKAEGGMNEQIRELIVDPAQLTTTWDDIVGLESVKQVLHEMVILPSLNPEVFTGLREPPKGLLIFGPPGNGKTLIARALAAACNSTFFAVSASSLTSRWYGEGEKLIRALFEEARKESPSIIFFDEIDSVISARGGSEHEASRRAKTEFFIQVDGMASSGGERVVCLAATNRPFDLDSAALRRFTRRIFVPLPAAVAREKLIRELMVKVRMDLRPNEFAAVVRATEGYSFADLTTLCRDAAMGALRELPAERISTITQDEIRPLRFGDFEHALHRIRASVPAEQIAELMKWNAEYGSR